MKITDVKCTPVMALMEAPLRWSMGVETGTVRTIIQMYTDEGVVGIGETYGGASIARRIEEMKPLFIGLDPLEVQTLIKRFEVFRVTSEQMAAAAETKYVAAGLEIACWDIIGKVLNKPLYKLWGDIGRREIPFVAYVFYRYEKDGIGGETTPEDIVRRYGEMVDRYGFEGIKLKSGVMPPEEELEAVRQLRREFGDKLKFMRFDPNQAWSVETSIRILRKMAEYDLEYVEDPTWDINGMALVRRDVPIPFATNQAVINFSQLPPAIKMRAIDVLLVDLYFWGGPSQAQKVATVCETFNIGLALHSDRELGIGTAANLHFAASTPILSHHYDTHYHDQVGDVITEPHQFVDGKMRVPQGPGLGVTIDEDRLKYHAKLYAEHGDRSEFFDPARPNWIPRLPLW
jgi:glucarate dehydratase